MISTKTQFHPLGENQRQPYPLLTNHPNPKIEPPNPKNTNQNPKKLPHSSLASIKIQTIPPI
ncbi:hypothetical protein BAZOLSSOX_1802 [uncultured Gammaproteobacteria bacterium]|nr:hypothetical protein BAZOLSSOX_1802 [uncultured Gammaproteobacteria bacterium]